MRHIPASDIVWAPAGSEHFTGEVWFGPLSHAEPEGLNALAVWFTPRARTDWHRHPEGQVLYVTSGAGWVATEDGGRVHVAAGDVVYAPPGQVHWHGAAPASPMVHLSLTTGGPTEWLGRKVEDSAYEPS